MRRSVFFTEGKNVYPSPTRGRGQRIELTPLRRCIQCGTPNDVRTTSYSKSGEGLIDIEGTSPQDRQVGAGCKFCGSLNWLPTKPSKLPDDRMLPAKENMLYGKRRRRW